MYFISKLMFALNEKYYGCGIFFHRTHKMSENTHTVVHFSLSNL
jgi:hypothetical protein